MGQNKEPATAASYSLTLSEQERMRYRMMARGAEENEAAEWSSAGIREGARIADVGCGPGAVLRLLAEHVGTKGSVIGVDADPAAVSMAIEEIEGLAQAGARVGSATDTGLDSGSCDVVMCRHVLAHNGGHEVEIVAHLASIAAPGGCVYLADVDTTALRNTANDPDLDVLFERYNDFQRARGNDLSVGLRLGDLLIDAGLVVESYACRAPVLQIPPGMRPPSWAARTEMAAAGFATNGDVTRWEEAFARLDAAERRPWLFPATFVALGRRR
jgi:ubiquinone/menaquinone biosynthesis C-methylase UbiE